MNIPGKILERLKKLLIPSQAQNETAKALKRKNEPKHLEEEIRLIIQEAQEDDEKLRADTFREIVMDHKLTLNQIKYLIARTQGCTDFDTSPDALRAPRNFPDGDFSANTIKNDHRASGDRIHKLRGNNLGLDRFTSAISKMKVAQVPKRFSDPERFTLSTRFNDVYRNAYASIKTKQENAAYCQIVQLLCDAGVTSPKWNQEQLDTLKNTLIHYLTIFETNRNQLNNQNMTLMETFQLDTFEQDLRDNLKFVYDR